MQRKTSARSPASASSAKSTRDCWPVLANSLPTSSHAQPPTKPNSADLRKRACKPTGPTGSQLSATGVFAGETAISPLRQDTIHFQHRKDSLWAAAPALAHKHPGSQLEPDPGANVKRAPLRPLRTQQGNWAASTPLKLTANQLDKTPQFGLCDAVSWSAAAQKAPLSANCSTTFISGHSPARSSSTSAVFENESPSVDAELARLAAALESKSAQGFTHSGSLLDRTGCAASLITNLPGEPAGTPSRLWAGLGRQRHASPAHTDHTGGNCRQQPTVSTYSDALHHTVSAPRQQKQQPRRRLTDWGVPTSVAQAYAERKVTTMYPWQAAALECAEDGANLVYCAPTSGGKSLVAEVLLVRRLLATYRPELDTHKRRRMHWPIYGRALFVLPYLSVVAEKTAHLAEVLAPMGCTVKGYFGTDEDGTPLGPRGECVAVCTIEKANVTINKLAAEGRLSELVCVVVDELHMVGDPQRGLPLELLMTKALFSPHCDKLQLVGMSATMGGLDELCAWMRARLFMTNYRPVPLTEHAVFEGCIFSKVCNNCPGACPLEALRELPASPAPRRDPHRLVPLVAEVVRERQSVLIFCATRKACEACAKLLADLLPSACGEQAPAPGVEAAAARAALVLELQQAMHGAASSDMQALFMAGVAYHHAGLTAPERRVVEGGYRSGALLVLCATSTLAAGINLPARRVILRSLRQGMGPVKREQYLQMVGRAGRAGQSAVGEAYIIGAGQPGAGREWSDICSLLMEPLPVLRSALLDVDSLDGLPVHSADTLAEREERSKALQRLLLECLASKLLREEGQQFEIQRLLRTTLAYHHFGDRMNYYAVAALRHLQCERLIRTEDTAFGSIWRVQPKGCAVYDSALPAHVGKQLYLDLAAAGRCLVLGSKPTMVHLMYVCILDHPFTIDKWEDWGTKIQRCVSKDIKRVAAQLKIDLEACQGRAMGRMDEAIKAKHCRLVAACAMHALLQEHPAAEVAKEWGTLTKSGVSAGQIEALQTNLSKWAAMAAMLAQSAGWDGLEVLLGTLSQQAAAGARAHLQPLMKVPDMDPVRARALHRAGLTSPEALAVASEEDVARALRASLPAGLRAQPAAAEQRLGNGFTSNPLVSSLLARTAKTLLAGARTFLEKRRERDVHTAEQLAAALESDEESMG